MRRHELKELQAQPLDKKVELAQRIIKDALKVAKKPAIAFSGGKDSQVVAHMVLDQALKTPAIFGDTGVEFPESRKFAVSLPLKWGFDLHIARPERTVTIGYKYAAQRKIWDELIRTKQIHKVLKPDGKLKTTRSLENACPAELRQAFEKEVWKPGTMKGFFWCVDQYGWPIFGKNWSKLDARRINIDTFLRFSETKSTDPDLIEYYRILKAAKISQHCCKELKKKPSEKVQAELGVDLVFKGLLANESLARAINFMSRGWLFEGKKQKYLNGARMWHCQPLATWTDRDIWEYINRYNMPYAPLYDLTYVTEKGERVNIQRNGCMFCATDFKFKSNHLYALRQTHPKAWSSVMRRGLGQEILNIQNVYKKHHRQQSLWGEFGVDALVDKAPCVFDTVRI